MRISRRLILCLLPTSAVFASDALDLARWAPKESYFVLTWQGADAATPAFEKSQLGQLWAEPQFQAFVMTPLPGLKELIKKAIREDDPDADRLFPIVKQVMTQMWRRPGMVCAFPAPADAENSEDWPVDDAIAAAWKIGPDAARLFDAIFEQARKQDETVRRETFAGVTWLRSAEAPIYFGHQKERWLLATGRAGAQRIAEQQEGSGPGFADTPAHARAVQRFRDISTLFYENLQTHTARERIVSIVRRFQDKGDIPRSTYD
jgi:hypothetical protein